MAELNLGASPTFDKSLTRNSQNNKSEYIWGTESLDQWFSTLLCIALTWGALKDADAWVYQ